MAPLPETLQGHPLSRDGGLGPGLYVHVPFCRIRCPYCDFATAPHTDLGARRFLAAIRKEAEALSSRLHPEPFETVFLGGGTPSRLGPESMTGLLADLGSWLPWRGDAEVTLEANPEDARGERLDAWQAGGVNRVSIGVQSFDDGELSRLGRGHDAEAAERAARSVGERWPSWSVDLMYGFPGHDLESWRRTLERAVLLGPPHVSAYHFTPEPHTALGDPVRDGRVAVAGDEEAAELFDEVGRVLGAAGYERYEVSNFARPGHRSRHNHLYWRRRPYLGLGPSAVSFWEEKRWKNERDADRYAARVTAGHSWVEEEEDVADRAQEEIVLLSLRLAEGVRWADLEAAGDATPWRAAAGREAQGGWLLVDAEGFRVPEPCRRLTDEITLRLWRAAESEAGVPASAPRILPR